MRNSLISRPVVSSSPTCVQFTHLHRHGIAQRVLLKHESFYDHMFDGGRAYDVIHFASSFMLMPDQVPSPSSALASLVFLLHSIAAQRLALQHAKTIIKPGGVIIFAQTMEKKNFMGFIARYTKPLLTFFLRIDFGKVTYESDFYDLLRVRRSILLLRCPSAAPRSVLLSCLLPTEGYEVQHVEPMARSVIKGGAQCILAKVAPSSAG